MDSHAEKLRQRQAERLEAARATYDAMWTKLLDGDASVVPWKLVSRNKIRKALKDKNDHWDIVVNDSVEWLRQNGYTVTEEQVAETGGIDDDKTAFVPGFKIEWSKPTTQ